MKRKLSENTPLHYANETKENSIEENKWPRPSLPIDFSSKTHSINFQQMDINYTIEDNPLLPNRNAVPVIKMYGCSEEGYSIALSIYNFMAYIYTPVPIKIQKDLTNEVLCTNFLSALNVYIIFFNDINVISLILYRQV